MRALVTGGAGLVGSETARLLCEEGWQVVTVDNYARGRIFGTEASTAPNIERLKRSFPIEHHELDVRDPAISELVQGVDLIVHTAAQPSHPRSIEIPQEDFEINVLGTQRLLEATRQRNPGAVFIFTSTNKVYGDLPNYFAYERVGKRYRPLDPALEDGFDETLRIDQCLHTPFGASKASADLYAQEYARMYGLKTGIFRMCCITGGMAMAVEQHNWEPYFVRKAMAGERVRIFGHEGYQVRDVIHARDLAKLFLEFYRHPRPGEVYNIGGGAANSVSLLEAMDLIERIVGKPLLHDFAPAREGDHIWWITKLDKVRRHFPAWDVRISLEQIFQEIHEAQKGRLPVLGRS